MHFRTVLTTVAVVLLLFSVPVNANASQYVSVTLTSNVQLVSITCNTTSIDFGTVGPGSTASSLPFGQSFWVTNNGTCPVKLKVAGHDALGPDSARLNLVTTTPGTDQFRLRFIDTSANPIAYDYLASGTLYPWPGDPTIPTTGSRSFQMQWENGQPTTYGQYSAQVSFAAYGQ